MIAIALLYFLEPNAMTWSYVVLAGALTTVVMAALVNFLDKWKVPALTAPFGGAGAARHARADRSLRARGVALSARGPAVPAPAGRGERIAAAPVIDFAAKGCRGRDVYTWFR